MIFYDWILKKKKKYIYFRRNNDKKFIEKKFETLEYV